MAGEADVVWSVLDCVNGLSLVGAISGMKVWKFGGRSVSGSKGYCEVLVRFSGS